MTERYKIVIVGSGPAGLSAAARAAILGVPHLLLERTDHLADTIYKYQKRKPVMAEPPDQKLPLRSDIAFGEGRREEVLQGWADGSGEHGVNTRFNADVTAITRIEAGAGVEAGFELTINGDETIQSTFVVLAIGLQGNLRKLAVDGADWERVQYQLDDPDDYHGETIVVAGGGDAGIENAIALSEQNRVIILNRQDGFPRAKEANRRLIESAIGRGDIDCYFQAEPKRVEPGLLEIEVPTGTVSLPCDRIVARLGAIAPRRFLESIGIEFPSASSDAIPELSDKYESNLPGLYIVGALGGYPLIKQALNQGHDVVEFILGNDIEPVQDMMIRQKCSLVWEGDRRVESIIDQIRETVPLLSGLTRLQLKDFLNDAHIHAMPPETTVFERNDFSSSVYMILEGSVKVFVDLGGGATKVIEISAGAFFGEISLIAGRRRTATVVAGEASVLIEAPRQLMITLLNSVESAQRVMDFTAARSQLKAYVSERLTDDVITAALADSEIERYNAGEVLFDEGDDENGVYLIRKGSVTVSRAVAGQTAILAYVPAGHYVGEMAFLNGAKRNATIRAAIATEVIRLPSSGFRALIDSDAVLRREVEARVMGRVAENEAMEFNPGAGERIDFLVQQGVGEATDMLLINESLCIHCDNCEKACAATHQGISRLDREAGPTIASLHVPTACRHCEHPHCMSDCPPDALSRAPDGEVIIDAEICIGCKRCAQNCPYDVIHMAPKEPVKRPSLISWFLFGLGSEPGAAVAPKPRNADAEVREVAVKCDMCEGIKGGAACVRSCPTGAAIRISPEEFLVRSNLIR